MIDFHSHILPGIDDGSKSVCESIKLLEMLKEQGITKVVATPHFYANQNPVSEFMKKRKSAYETLAAEIADGLPHIILGAEVKYYEGISRLDNLDDLCIGDSKLLLLEMPMKRWTEYTLRELSELNSRGSFRIVLAHVERYLSFQPKLLIEDLTDSGILMQSNADFFLNLRSRFKAIKMLRNGQINFIGSDCHGVTFRPPHIGDAYSLIRRKFGDGFVDSMYSNINSYLI